MSGVAWSLNGEDFSHDSMQDAIDAATDDLEPGQVVYFGDAVKPASNFVDMDDVIELIGERAYDIGGEHAEGFPDVSKEAAAELASFLEKWQAEHCAPNFWTVRNVQEHVLTAADLGGEA